MTKCAGLSCLVVAATLVAATQAQTGSSTPDNVSSKLMIHIPHSLFKESGYEHREALFGMPPYGGSIAQNVYYADADLCGNDVDTSRGYPARPMENGKMKSWESPFILMVDRGGCTFVKKVRNAQRAGAAGVIIADNACLCSDQPCMTASGTTQCETAEPIMADDGSGADISIPSFLMFKVDADKVKDELIQNHPVQIEMSWKLPNPDDRVEYDLWTVPKDPSSQEFLATFKKLAVALGDKAYFTPHQYIYDGIRSHCQGNDGENFCFNLCTNNGRYCATDPDNDLEIGISGADVVRESLRRLCIWANYGAVDGIGVQWWDYVAEFTKRCDSPDYFAYPDCVKDAYKHAGVDGDLIARCMTDSGGLDADTTNAKLDKEIQSQTQRGVVVIPTVSVSSTVLRTTLSATNVFAAICASFQDGTAPHVCQRCGHCYDAVVCVERGHCPSFVGGGPAAPDHPGGADSRGSLLVPILCAAVVAFRGGYYYRMTQLDDLRERVRNILILRKTESLPLKENPLKEGPTNDNKSIVDDPRDSAKGKGDPVQRIS